MPAIVGNNETIWLCPFSKLDASWSSESGVTVICPTFGLEFRVWDLEFRA